jgi:IclR family transcriptional regulator, acetate operon repressor
MEGTNTAVLRALAILDYLSTSQEGLRLKDVASVLRLPESTAHRLLNSLATRGYVQQSPRDQRYRIGWKAVTLARAVDREVRLVENIHPYLEQLAKKTGFTANLAVLQQDQVLYLDCVVPPQSIIALYTTPGSFVPAHATSLGKVLLAGLAPDALESALTHLSFAPFTSSTVVDASEFRASLATIQTQGYAVDHGEYVPDVNCAAAPVTYASGEVVAAISVTARAAEFPVEQESKTVSVLLEAVREASRRT